LNGGVFNAEFFKPRFHFCHNFIADGNFLVGSDDVGAEGNVT